MSVQAAVGAAPDLATERVIDFVHRDFVTLDGNLTVKRAIEALQRRKDDGRILYFYVVDEEARLIGVMPARLFITRDPAKKLSEVCLREIVTVGTDISLLDAAKIFERHRFLSLPAVDHRGRLVGVLDLHVFTSRKIDLSDRAILEEVFQTIGIRLGGLVGAGPLKSWRLRFPWLLSTLAGGALCVLVSAIFETTLAMSLVLAIFLAPILALGESTAIQSMTISLQILGLGSLQLREAVGRVAREATTGLLLGAGAGILIFLLEVLWKGLGPVSYAILASVALAMCAASIIGFVLPWLLFRLKVNLKVAAGPIVLAVADVSTILIYLGLASLALAA
jgi:magnesium transporter